MSNTQISCILAGTADSMPISHSRDPPPTHFSTAICFRADDRLNGHFQWNYSQRHSNISIPKLPSENITQSSFLFFLYFTYQLVWRYWSNIVKFREGIFLKCFSSQVFCLFRRCTTFLCCYPIMQTVKYSCHLLGRRRVDGFFWATTGTTPTASEKLEFLHSMPFLL